jgi:uncharacterized protein YndB with AHSA1/START domain
VTPEADPPAGREVRITRSFDAPRELVFRAWLDPDQIAAWMAPEGVEMPRSSIKVDARRGGVIEYSMVDPDSGQEYPVVFEIVEISDPELLLFESPAQPELGFPERTATRVVFEEDGDRTTVTITQGPHTDETIQDAQAGWTSVLDNLDALLAG